MAPVEVESLTVYTEVTFCGFMLPSMIHCLSIIGGELEGNIYWLSALIKYFSGDLIFCAHLTRFQ